MLEIMIGDFIIDLAEKIHALFYRAIFKMWFVTDTVYIEKNRVTGRTKIIDAETGIELLNTSFWQGLKEVAKKLDGE
jgi:hypothetical protein